VIILTSAIFFTNIPSIVSQLSSSGHRDFWNNADIAIRSHSMRSDGALVLNVRNNKAAPINIEQVWIGENSYPISENFEPSERKIIQININENSKKGDYYHYKIGFDYLMVGQNFEFKPGVPITGNVQ
jgi:hypothetical protein